MKTFRLGRIFLSLYSFSTLSGCSQDVQFASTVLDSSLSSGQAVTETFSQGVQGKMLDILFVVDNSGSMADEQAKLGDRIDRFISTLEDVDWRIGITTTDVSNGAYGVKGSLLNFSGLQTNYITAKTPNYLNVFKNTIVRQESINCIPECPSGDEQPLAAAIMAIQKRNTENQGFFREGADLGLLVLSDEDEKSTGPISATSPSDLLQVFANTWSDSKRLLTYGIVIVPGDQSCLDQQMGQGHYGQFVSSLAMMTEGIVGSICESDYAPTLGEIANHARRLQDYVVLKEYPIFDSIEIRFQPQHQTSFRLEGKRLYFDNPPVKGTIIYVDYVVQ